MGFDQTGEDPIVRSRMDEHPAASDIFERGPGHEGTAGGLRCIDGLGQVGHPKAKVMETLPPPGQEPVQITHEERERCDEHGHDDKRGQLPGDVHEHVGTGSRGRFARTRWAGRTVPVKFRHCRPGHALTSLLSVTCSGSVLAEEGAEEPPVGPTVDDRIPRQRTTGQPL